MRKREKKKFLPFVVLMILFWGSFVAMVALVDPAILRDFPIQGAYSLFFLVFFLAWFFLLSLIFNNSRRGFIYSFGMTVFLGLRLIKLGNVVNGLLILGLLVVIDFYLSSR